MLTPEIEEDEIWNLLDLVSDDPITVRDVTTEALAGHRGGCAPALDAAASSAIDSLRSALVGDKRLRIGAALRECAVQEAAWTALRIAE